MAGVALPKDHDVTELLQAWRQGDDQALEALAPRVQKELHRLARRHMAGERPNHPLQTTALINEAYIRLIGWDNVQWVYLDHGNKHCIPPPMGSHLLVILSPAPPKDWIGPDAMGFAPAHTNRAYVFHDRVKRFMQRFGQDENEKSRTGIVLGHAIAHELGPRAPALVRIGRIAAAHPQLDLAAGNDVGLPMDRPPLRGDG